MSIVHWNCRGYRGNFEDLKTLIMHYSAPSCICLQETFHGSVIPRPPKGYHIMMPPNPVPPPAGTTRPSRGILTLVKNNIPYYEIPLSTSLEAHAVRINLGREYTICNIYISPTESLYVNDLINLTHQLPAPFFLAGDFNARSQDWGDSMRNSHGRKIQELLLSTDYVLLNTGQPTHFST